MAYTCVIHLPQIQRIDTAGLPRTRCSSPRLYICLKYRGLILNVIISLVHCFFSLYICLKYRGLILDGNAPEWDRLFQLYICLKYRGLIPECLLDLGYFCPVIHLPQIQRIDTPSADLLVTCSRSELYICLKYRGLIP